MAEEKEKKRSFIVMAFFMIVAFAFGGAGLGILFNSKGDLASVIIGFVLIGLAISIVASKLIENE